MNLKNFFYTLLLVTLTVPVLGQDIKVDDLDKIEFTTSGSFSRPFLRVTEVVPEGNAWKCYQKLHYEEYPKQIKDSTRQFVRMISHNDLKQLIYNINHPDTVLNLTQFNISKAELTRSIDTLQAHAKRSLAFQKGYHSYSYKEDSILANLTGQQRSLFKKAINSKQAVEDASLKTLDPMAMDDAYYYAIVFTYRDKHKDTISAYLNPVNIYHLPWRFKGLKNYNPRLTDLFEFMNNNEKDVAGHKAILIYSIDDELFSRWVGTKIYWDNYKNNHPSNYALLSKTLTPAELRLDGHGQLKSDMLPFNIQLRTYFSPNDTLVTRYYNKTEKDMVELYNQGSFLFDYLKAHPTYIAFTFGNVAAKTIKQLEAIYPPVARFDSTQVKRLYIASDYYQHLGLTTSSGWLLLPDGTTILTMCSDQLIRKDQSIFSMLTPKGKSSGHYVCIVFDKSGHKIAGDESPVKIDVN